MKSKIKNSLIFLSGTITGGVIVTRYPKSHVYKSWKYAKACFYAYKRLQRILKENSELIESAIQEEETLLNLVGEPYGVTVKFVVSSDMERIKCNLYFFTKKITDIE